MRTRDPGPVRRGGPAALIAALCVGAVLLAPSEPCALTAEDLAVTLDGETVSLGEVDAVTDGALARSWREINAIIRSSTRAICGERLLAADIARRAGRDLTGWRAALWERSLPGDGEVAAALASRQPAAAGAAFALQIAHALHVDRYRQAIARATGALLADAYVPDPAISEALADGAQAGERPLPRRLARCAAAEVTRAEVEQFAAFPLYRRRAAIVAAACRQLAPDYAMPLVLARLARERGSSVEALEKSLDGDVAPPSDAEIAEVAKKRYGHVSRAERAKVRLALTAVRRSEARLAWRTALLAKTTSSCALRAPVTPKVMLRARSGSPRAHPAVYAVPVTLFGAFRCHHCAATWEIVASIRADPSTPISFALRHYFPDKSLAAFEDAVAAECSRRQGRFWDYVAASRQRGAAGALQGPVEVAGLDRAAAVACAADPRTAVQVLADDEEGRRLGFGDAIPSWVVAGQPRRGFQGERVVRDMIEAARRENATRRTRRRRADEEPSR